MTRWLSITWQVGVALLGVGVAWGALTAAVHNSVTQPEMQLHILRDSIEKADIRRIVLDARRISLDIKCNPEMKPSPWDTDCKGR